MILLLHITSKPGTSVCYPVPTVERLRAWAEPTKSSKAGHIVPDKLQAHQPPPLYDVIWDA